MLLIITPCTSPYPPKFGETNTSGNVDLLGPLQLSLVPRSDFMALQESGQKAEQIRSTWNQGD